MLGTSYDIGNPDERAGYRIVPYMIVSYYYFSNPKDLLKLNDLRLFPITMPDLQQHPSGNQSSVNRNGDEFSHRD